MKKTSSLAKHKRQKAEKQGRLQEWLAAVYLQLKGYRLKAKRARTPFGEIDLILQKGNNIIFCEVKYRQKQAHFASAISPQQQQRIAHGAHYWLSTHGHMDKNARIDVVFMRPFAWPKHHKNVIFFTDRDIQKGL